MLKYVRCWAQAHKQHSVPPLTCHFEQLKAFKGKQFTLRLDVMTRSKTVYQVSLSSMYRGRKLLGKVAQLPLVYGHLHHTYHCQHDAHPLPPSSLSTSLPPSWTVLVLDMPKVLQLATGGVATAAEYESIKAVTMCSTMAVRNVYTSDNAYTIDVRLPPRVQQLCTQHSHPHTSHTHITCRRCLATWPCLCRAG